MAQRTCSIDDCPRKVFGHGFCQLHHRRWRTHGDPLKTTRTFAKDPEHAFEIRTEWQGECLIWIGTTAGKGYGQLYRNGKRVYTHRYAWERVNGKIPKNMHVGHICHNPSCVNVDHLRLTNRHQNMANRAGVTSHSSSGVRNVYRSGNRWFVKLARNKEQYYFGTYDTIKEASRVAEKARKDLFGDYAGKG